MELKLYIRMPKRRCRHNFETIKFSSGKNKPNCYHIFLNKFLTEKVITFKYVELYYGNNNIFGLKFLNHKTNNSYIISKSFSGKSSSIASTHFIKDNNLKKVINKFFKIEQKDGLWIADLNKPLEE